jgi:hypothetical protein
VYLFFEKVTLIKDLDRSQSFSSNFSESLTTNSTWSQSGGGPAIGANKAIYSRNSVYSGGSGGGYGGYGGSFSYSGGQNWTWSDPNRSTYDAHALSEIRITPNGPAEIGPVMFRSAPNVAAVMPPSLVEDTEAAAVEKGEESAIGRFLWSLVPGSSLVGAYRDYQKGSYVSAALNGLFGLADLATVGSLVKARSGLKLLVGFMKVRVKDALVDEAANQAGVAVAERLGPEAGFVTQIIVSATLSKNVRQQNKTQLGFAEDTAKKINGSYAIGSAAAKGLRRNAEHIESVRDSLTARRRAAELAGLGSDTVHFVSKVGPQQGWIVGRQSKIKRWVPWMANGLG